MLKLGLIIGWIWSCLTPYNSFKTMFGIAKVLNEIYGGHGNSYGIVFSTNLNWTKTELLLSGYNIFFPCLCCYYLKDLVPYVWTCMFCLSEIKVELESKIWNKVYNSIIFPMSLVWAKLEF